MSPAEIFALIAFALSLALVGVGAIVTGLRISALNKRARRLESHPTLAAGRRFSSVAARFSGVGERFAIAGDRLARIGESSAQIASAAAVLGLNVDRVAFATRLLLSTFMPAMAGVMAER